MKKIFTIGLALALAAGAFAQVNLWRKNGYLTQFDKATLDSITLSMINPYTVEERQIEYYHTPTGETRDMFDLMKAYGLVFASARADDFGQPAACLYIESRGQDFIGAETTYNWFQSWHHPNDWAKTNYAACRLVWWTCYTPILAANYVIATRTSGSKDDNYAVAQAKALRAFEYMQLAQGYQVAYNESSLNLPCVPLVLDTIYSSLILGQEPATVAQVYAQIKTDLDAACTNLEGYVRPSKHVINQAVAYGLRARYNLLVHNYNQAAADAEQALLLSGATPLSIEEANQPGFADASAHNVLWANIINEEDAVIQAGYEAAINNWVSHMSTFYQQGYTGVGATRSIASALYNEIPASDVRKGWWLNENLESPLLDAPGYNAAKAAIQSKAENVYVNVKFGTGDGTTSGRAAAAGDWIMMRAEELILLRAEALARAGKDGASVLSNFVKTYRDPNYDINAHGLSVADEIWWQRRVELWGEGFGYFDLMRLHKGITRTNSSNWPSAWQVDLSADDERLPLLSPTKAENYKALAVWRNGEKDLYNTYYISVTAVDSITMGEAKEIDDVRFYGVLTGNGINSIYTYDFSQPLQRSIKEEEMAAHPDTLTIRFWRDHNRREAITVPLIVEADSAFANTVFPSEISLCGYNDTSCYSSSYAEIQIVVSNMPLGTHRFTITIPDEYAQGITDAKSFTYEITVREPDEWDTAETKTGVWVDDAGLCSTFGISAGLAWIVEYKSVELPDNAGTRIRVINAYKTIATEEDPETGLPNGYPYADEFTIREGDYNFSLDLLADGTALFGDEALLGLAYSSYGDLVLVNMAANSAGVYDAEAGRATFDAASRSYAFGFNNAGNNSLYNYAGFRFYLSKEAYLADQPEPDMVDADVNTYVGNWTIKGLDINEEEEVPVSANVTITSHVDEDGQYYTLEGLYENMPVVYGTFDEATHKFKIEYTEGDPVEIGGTSYIPVLYMVDANWSLSSSITLDIVPGEDGGLVTDEESAAIGFIIVYFNEADPSQYAFGEGMFDISFEPANTASAPVHNAVKTAKRVKSDVKRINGKTLLMPKIGKMAVKPLTEENKNAVRFMTNE